MFYIPGATLFSFLIPSQSLEILLRYMNSLLNPPPWKKEEQNLCTPLRMTPFIRHSFLEKLEKNLFMLIYFISNQD